MSFLKDKEALTLTALFFGIFLFLFMLVTFVSLKKFSPGQGLGKSVSKQAIAQFVVRGESNSSFGIDVRPGSPAMRVPYDTPMIQNIIIHNLGQDERIEEFRMEIVPSELAESVVWSMTWPLKLKLGPGEEKILPLGFLIDRKKFKTRDGIITLKVSY